MSDKGKMLSSVVFKFFGGMYEAAMRGLATAAPSEVKQAFVILINEARARSGLPKEKTLAMLKLLREVLDHIIQNETT